MTQRPNWHAAYKYSNPGQSDLVIGLKFDRKLRFEMTAVRRRVGRKSKPNSGTNE